MRYLTDAALILRATGEPPRGSRHPGPWVTAQRTAAKHHLSSMTAERQALLDEHLPGWRESPIQPLRVSWPESAAEVRVYVRETGRFPRQNGDTPDEARLGMWLANQRSARRSGELDSGVGRARAAWLTEHVRGWEGRGERDEVWEQTARELGVWLSTAEVGRWPNRRSADADERRLGTWRKNRRDDRVAGRLSAERIALLDQLAPGWQG